MTDDPKGYYARLDLDHDAAPAAIAMAYHRKAKLFHPDVPGTGNTAAFVAVKEAYDVLANPLTRAAYDREARATEHRAPREARRRPPAEWADQGEEILPDPPPPMPPIRTRQPRWSDLPVALWAVLGGAVLIAAVELVLHLATPTAPVHLAAVPASAPLVPPAPPAAVAVPRRLAGVPNFYILPAGGPAAVWRHDDTSGSFVPLGQLPPFSAVQALRLIRENGLVEIRLSDTTTGFLDASRLSPGNATAARQAYCAYNAGPPPANAEVLARHGSGSGRLSITNRSGQPAVVKLRDAQGVTAAMVFLQPGGDAEVDGLPPGAYRPEYAIGELWSRACNSFAAGMRTQRFPGLSDLSALTPLRIPPDLSGAAAPVDIPDQAFERE